MARVSSRPGAKAVLRRPRFAGTRQYIVMCEKKLGSNVKKKITIYESKFDVSLPE